MVLIRTQTKWIWKQTFNEQSFDRISFYLFLLFFRTQAIEIPHNFRAINIASENDE